MIYFAKNDKNISTSNSNYAFLQTIMQIERKKRSEAIPQFYDP